MKRVFALFLSALLGSTIISAQTTLKGSILSIDFSEGIAERGGNDLTVGLNGISTSSNLALLSVERAIEKAAGDDKIAMIFLKTDKYNSGLASSEELRKCLESFRASGKKVVSYATTFNDRSYYLASGSDLVVMNPSGDGTLSGMSSTLLFYKDILDTLGVKVQLIRHGKYKSAGEPYIRSDMSEAQKEQYEMMLGTIWNMMAEAIASSRDFTAEQFNEWIDNLSISNAEAAKEKGLVDELWYDDQVRDYFCTLCDVKKTKDLKYVSLKDYAAARVKSNLRAKEKIAVIYADGEIVMDDRGNGSIGNNFAKEIAKARQDSSIKAVVFRVNSPGGSVQASAAIEREIELLKADKPVVASYGGYAASGGYWISCGADKIFSDKSTLTGSIGVFGLIPSFGKALKKNVHLNVYEVSTHKHGALATGMSPLDPEEEAMMQKQIDETYEDFIGRVAAGRGLTTEAVDEIAQGRVWAGGDAIKIGLVDELGGLTDAIRYAASMASLENYRVVTYPAVVPMYNQLLSSMNETGTDQDIRSDAVGVTERTARWLLGLDGPEIAARMPEIKVNLK